jgi:molybdopterin synthase catalytic subunit
MLGRVTVRVRLFAGLRERAGWSEREVEAATVADVWPALDLGDEPGGLLYAVDEVRDDRAGAIATFTGTTRAESRGRDVVHLDYEAYEGMAEAVMEEIASELRAQYDLCEIAIHHRTGRVAIGETSVLIAVSARHRADALSACRDAIDRLKERVPLWKKEVYRGGEEWIGRGS